MPQLAPTKRLQVGMALLEALVALLILAFGVLGLLWMHQQALVQQRQQLMRSVAIGIADDLAERMHLNAAQHTLYAKAWGASAPAAPDCVTTLLTPRPCRMGHATATADIAKPTARRRCHRVCVDGGCGVVGHRHRLA